MRDRPPLLAGPPALADLGDEVAAQLTEIDPDHADDYAANAADLRADLEASTGSTPTGWPTAPATRSWSATTPSATWRSTA